MELHEYSIPASLWFSAILVSTQSFLYGYIFSCLNTCLVAGNQNNSSACYDRTDSSCPPGTIYNTFNLSVVHASLATGLVIAGGWAGSMIGTKPAEKYGRRLTLIYNSFTFILGSVCTASGNYSLLFAGRFICGLGVGIISVICPVLLSEIATDGTRGTITTLYMVVLTFSILVASLIGLGFVTNVNHGWQYVQGFAAIPSFLLGATPESISLEMELIKSDCNINDQTSTRCGTACLVVRGDGLQAGGDHRVHSNGFTGNQLPMSGINTLIFYSTTIFSFAGFSPPILGTILLGIVNFIITIVSAYIVDHLGRKILLLGGTYIMTASLIALSSVLLSSQLSSSTQGSLAVVFVLLYIVGFAIGLGSVCWVVMSEIMPTRLRVKAMSLFLNINWAVNLVIAMATLPVINSFGGVKEGQDDDSAFKSEQKTGVAYLYLGFAGFGFLTILFLHFYVPETKNHMHFNNEESIVKTPLLSGHN